MPANKKTKKDKEDEKHLKQLSSLFKKQGIEVRRERLYRGSGFRVKSGNCLFSGDDLLFLDRRLPLKQQLSVMIDWMVEKDIKFDTEDLETLPNSLKSLLVSRKKVEIDSNV